MAHDEGQTVDCLQIRSEERATEKGTQEGRSAESNRRPSSSRPGESRDPLHCGAGGAESSTAPENLPQDEQGSKATRAAKSSSPKARRGSTNTPSPPAGRTEKKQRSSSKTVSPNRDATDKSATAAHSYHAEQMTKYVTINSSSKQAEIRHVKVKSGPSFPVTLPFIIFQAGSGAEETERRAADEQAERAGAAKSHLQLDQQREEPETRGFTAQTVQHAAPEQVSHSAHPLLKACVWLLLWTV